jgi:hypothetical protein
LRVLLLLISVMQLPAVGAAQSSQVFVWNGACPTVLSIPGATPEWLDACHAMELARQAKSFPPLPRYSDEEIGPPAYGGGLRWSPEQMAMRAANQESVRGPRQSNDAQIQETLQRVKGSIRVTGWQARRIDDQTFLVVYSYSVGEALRGWVFEVNLAASVVRPVEGDPELTRKYGIQP